MADGKVSKAQRVGQPAQQAKGAADASTTVARVRALRERYAPLDPDHVAFFESRQSVEQARKAGARTVAADVLGDMVQLAVRYEQARSASATVARFVTPQQMRWLCDNIVLLGDAVDRRDKAGVTTVEVSTRVQVAWDDARPIRNELTGAMEECAKGRPVDEAALSEARGAADKPESTERSMVSLSALAAKWLAREDALSKIAASEATLTGELVDRAKAAAATLRAAIDADGSHEGSRRTTQDTPEINTLEGHVALSLKSVRQKHDRAREKDPAVAAVPIPDALKAALGVSAKAAAAPKNEAPPVTTDPAAPAVPRAAKRKRKKAQ